MAWPVVNPCGVVASYAWVIRATTRRALVQRIRDCSVPVLRTVHE